MRIDLDIILGLTADGHIDNFNFVYLPPLPPSLHITINYNSGLNVPVNQTDKIKTVMNLTENHTTRGRSDLIFLPDLISYI